MPPLVDLVPVVALLILLVTAYRHPAGHVEALIGLAAAGATLATGIIDAPEAWAAVQQLAPVVAFLATILVVADVCARAGLFVAAARIVGTSATAAPTGSSAASSCSPRS